MKEKKSKPKERFFDRDLSWLSFNERVLTEAEKTSIPLLERIRFLGIFSSNLDEFYRVRIPVLMASKKISAIRQEDKPVQRLRAVIAKITKQQEQFGYIIKTQILPALNKVNIQLVYNEAVPEIILPALKDYFLHHVASFIRIHSITKATNFFPENNKLYFSITTAHDQVNHLYIVNIPSDILPRFYSIPYEGVQYIVFLDDVIKANLLEIFPGHRIRGCHSVKITRDAELDLQDEFSGNLAKKIEKQIHRRDWGSATRFLHAPEIARETLVALNTAFNINGVNIIPGGRYHNLKDLSSLPLQGPQYEYEVWPQAEYAIREG
jgi:polyphosphate kinase